ncbi:LUD domain-containing protein [Lutibacter sp.]|uniref:LUD domain-containing protein n=1 Tax=Lutibacter sp. TaxID=1925666 RepID=UPI0025C44769|nr:LUD domain-containing protein [Lutibacter sp.]MCF6167896.1 LUD domain-containing protein [Lutibacter sp.]
MSFLKKLFSNPKDKKPEEPVLNLESLSLDQQFVKNFLKNNGKFLYCTTLEEVTSNLTNIIQENSWETITCNDYDLLKLIKTLPINIIETNQNSFPFFVSCEHLIAENGSILFSSNQLKESKISELTENFIVYATTSQLVKTNDDGLTGIKSRYQGNIPSNISAIKNYSPNSKNIDFMNYGNTNAKNLYLLLFEDL